MEFKSERDVIVVVVIVVVYDRRKDMENGGRSIQRLNDMNGFRMEKEKINALNRGWVGLLLFTFFTLLHTRIVCFVSFCLLKLIIIVKFIIFI